MVRRIFSAAITLRLLLRVVAAGAITTLTMATQTVKYAATQADLIAALGDDNTTVVLNSTILLESSTTVGTVATGIVIENAKGVVIDGARRRVCDRRARQNDLPIRAEQRRGAHRHHRDKWIFG